MKWIVLEESPKPDEYIVVLEVDEERFLKIERKPCSKFLTREEAINRARQLKNKFDVMSIRIFYIEGNSDIV